MTPDDTTLRTRLRAAVDGLPPDAEITFPVRRLEIWLTETAQADAEGGSGCHLTTAQAADRLNLQSSTVASWCASGRIPDAWKTGDGDGGEWRIPESALSEVGAEKEAAAADDRIRFDRTG